MSSSLDSKRISLLGPERPALGMRSAQDPATLPPGVWARLENLRCQSGTLRVREGASAVVASGLPGARGLRGLYSGTVDGSSRLVAAFRVPKAAGAALPISGASHTSPIVVTRAGHGLGTGDYVTMAGVLGNTAANGVWPVTVLDADTFALDGSAGNGAYGGGGTVTKMPFVTAVYRLTGSSWSEITHAGTRFANDGEVGFAVVRDSSIAALAGEPRDVLVFGNGLDEPRVATLGLLDSAVHAAPPLPKWATVTALPYGWMHLANGCRGFATDADFTFSVAPPHVSVSPSADGGDTISLLFDTAHRYDEGTTPDGLELQKEIVVVSRFVQNESLWDYADRLELLVDRVPATTIPVTGASVADPLEITAPGHGLSTGKYVRIGGVGGQTLANGVFRVTYVDANTFRLTGVNGTAGGAYTTGGTITELEWITAFDASTAADVLTTTEQASSTTRAIFHASRQPASVAAILTGEHEGRTGWCGIRLTSSGEAPTETRKFPLYTVATSGKVDGRSNFAVAYFNSASRAEGEALPAKSGQGVSLKSLGGVAAAATFRWEPDAQFRTAYRLAIPGTTGLAGHPDYALVYRSEPYLEEDGSVQFGAYFLGSGGDGIVPLPDSPGVGFTNDFFATADLDVTRTAKDVGHRTLPKGRLFATANDRLFVAGTGSPSELWVSADRDPFSFRQVPEVDDMGNQEPRSATYRTFGGERITALQPMQGDLYGVDTLLLWTDRGLYRLGGFDSRQMLQAGRLSEAGTHRAPAVAPDGGRVWYLDGEGQIRMTNGGLASQVATTFKVDDLLAAGDLTEAYGIAAFDAYRLFYREAGGDSVALVWQRSTGEWALDRFPFEIAGAVAHDVPPRRRMLAAEPNGKLWRLETPGQETEAGSPIPIVMEGPELSDGMWRPLTFGSIGVVCEGTVAAVLKTERILPYGGDPVEGWIHLAADASRAWRWDTTATGGLPGTEVCVACRPRLEGSLPGGKRIRSIVIQTEGRSGGADRA